LNKFGSFFLRIKKEPYICIAVFEKLTHFNSALFLKYRAISLVACAAEGGSSEHPDYYREGRFNELKVLKISGD